MRVKGRHMQLALVTATGPRRRFHAAAACILEHAYYKADR